MSSVAPNFPSGFISDIEHAVMSRSGQPKGNEIRFRCPLDGHEDRHPSASWNVTKHTWNCYICKVGGGALDLADRLGIDRPKTPSSAGTNRARRRIVTKYDYPDADGRLLFQVIRYEPKEFNQRRPDGKGGWIYNLQTITPVLYHLPEIIASNDVVWICEGEKDADRLRDFGLIATTCPMGAGKWRESYTEILANRDTVILPDHDPAGRAHAQDVARELHAVNCYVKVVDLPELPRKGDVSDWLDAGRTVDDLINVVGAAPEWMPEDEIPADEANPPPTGPILITAAELMRKVFPDPRWAVPGVFPEGLTLLVGAPKLGKSWLGLNIGLAVALGGRAIGKIPVDGGDVLYLALEDTERRLQERLMMTLQGASAPDRLAIATSWPLLGNGATEHLSDWLASHPDTRLVIVDTFQKVRGPINGNQNAYAADYTAAGELKRVADQYGVALVCIHHARKASADDPLDMVSGTNGLAGAADTICILQREIGRADAALYIRGRDVPETDHALSFDAATCSWTLLGDAAEYRVSEERRAIIDLLRDAPTPMSPKLIAEALGKKDGAIRKLLHMMVKAGEVDGVGGAYRLPLHPGNSGNAGNAQDHYIQTVTTVTGVTGTEKPTPLHPDMVPTAGRDRFTS